MTPIEHQAATAADVRAEMARKRRTQTELAAVLDVTPASAARRLTGAYPFNVYELALIGAWLDVDPARFMSAKTAGAA